MTVVDYLLWSAALAGVVGLGTWYGLSWRALASALAEAGRPQTTQPPPHLLREPLATGATPQLVGGARPARPAP